MKNLIPAEKVKPDALLGKTVAVVGYGNQGRPQALNLRDSGFNVVIGQRQSGKGFERAIEDGFEALPIEEAILRCDVMMLSLPDQLLGDIFRQQVWPSLREGQTILFSHGFAIHYGTIVPPLTVNVGLVAPKGAGPGVRSLFEAGTGVPGLVAVHHDATNSAMEVALAYAWGLGCGRQFVLRTSFEEETVTDLFGEQVVLCGGIPELVMAGFETLVQAGYAPEIAYFECLHETKLIIDLMVTRGLAGMREAISDTAEWGGCQVGPQVINENARLKLRAILDFIQSGEFASGWLEEAANGSPNLKSSRESVAESAIEQVGSQVRRLMQVSKPKNNEA